MYEEEKKEIIYWAKKMDERGFITARSGNISLKVDNGILMTSHDCYLGELREDDILLVDGEGSVLEGEREPTSEKELHLSVYKKFPETGVVLHSHSPYTVAFFHYFDKLDIFSFEAKFYLGSIEVIKQDTPTVTDTGPVLRGLGKSNIVVLGGHGVVSIGHGFKEAFSLIEILEEQAKVNLMLKYASKGVYTEPQSSKSAGEGNITAEEENMGRKYVLLSKEHADRLVELVNNDKEAQDLGRKYDLTCSLAVKNTDTGDCVCFYYKQGRIVKVDSSEKADFIVLGKPDILRKVFNREIDPFVASTQGKVKTKGDFTKMSKWYPVLVRTFKLWEQAPVE